MNSAIRPPSKTSGFSLIEIAVVLLIISILITIVAIPLTTQLDMQKTADTNKQLEQIKEAVYGFAMANGRLPCPALYVNATNHSSGRESFCVAATGNCPGTETTAVQTHGNCSNFVGHLPAATLGLSPLDSQGSFVDAWGLTQNKVRYAVGNLNITAGTPVACTNTITFPLTRVDGIKTATMGCLSDTNAAVNLLTVRSTTVTNVAGGCTPADLTAKAPFVIYSLGKNAPKVVTGADEIQNMSFTNTFVSHIPTPEGNCAGEFDDIVIWGSLNTLFARLVQAGKLP